MSAQFLGKLGGRIRWGLLYKHSCPCVSRCRTDLTNLKRVWEAVRVVREKHVDWKRHRWQRMNTRYLQEETDKQLETVRALPESVHCWDVYQGLEGAVLDIQV